MVAPDKRRMQYKFRKTASETKRVYFNGKSSKRTCAITGEVLSGTCSESRGKAGKKSKTQKRPTAPFGGVLGGKARHEVSTEMAKVVAGTKKMDDVDAKYRGYAKQLLKRADSE